MEEDIDLTDMQSEQFSLLGKSKPSIIEKQHLENFHIVIKVWSTMHEKLNHDKKIRKTESRRRFGKSNLCVCHFFLFFSDKYPYCILRLHDCLSDFVGPGKESVIDR